MLTILQKWSDLPWGTIWTVTIALGAFGLWALTMWLRSKFKPVEEIEKDNARLNARLEQDKDELLKAVKSAREGICQDVSDVRKDLERHEAHLDRYFATKEMLNGLAARIEAKQERICAEVEAAIRIFSAVDERASRALQRADTALAEIRQLAAIVNERERRLRKVEGRD